MSGGIIGYFGYEYQFYVSVLLLLQAYKQNPNGFVALGVETSFGQDAELLFNSPENDEEKSLVLLQANKSNSVQIQIKTKSQKYQWDASDIGKLLLKRDESGSSTTVLDRLINNPTEIFLFITDGMFNKGFAPLLADGIEVKGRRYPGENFKECLQSLKKSDTVLNTKLSEAILERVFLLGGLDKDHVITIIKHSLITDFCTPIGDTEQILRNLMDMVRDATLRQKGNSVTAQDLIGLVGLIDRIPFPSIKANFQPTPNDDQAEEIINSNHILILTGEPAVGKTTLAQMLVNKLSQSHYQLKELKAIDAHLEIFQECRGLNNVVFLLNDPFGDDDYLEQSGDVLANQFSEIGSQVKAANGRVKVIITTRLNTLSEAFKNPKFSKETIEKCTYEINQPDDEFIQKLLRFRLERNGVEPEVVGTILALFPSDSFRFENLLHVEEFAANLGRDNSRVSPGNLSSVFQETRPSLYRKWVKVQLPVCQVFLFALWATQEVSQFVSEKDFERVFDGFIKGMSLPPVLGFGSHYQIARENLTDQQRIVVRNQRIDFIHPLLKQAVVDFIGNQFSVGKQIVSIVEALRGSDTSLDQSIAAMLALRFYELTGLTPSFLQVLLRSRYLQVRDTFVRFGIHLLNFIDGREESEWKVLAKKIYLHDYSPADCEVDSEGNVIFKDDEVEGIKIYKMTDAWVHLQWEWGLAYKDGLFNDSDKIDLLKKCFCYSDYSSLNPIQRYIFVDYVVNSYNQENCLNVISLLNSLAYDPTSFVRSRVAKQLNNLITMQGQDFDLLRILKILSADSSPFVKIAVLESIVANIWVKQPSDVQDELLGLVCRMLDDPVVRERTSRGLIGQSGGLFFYHKNHSSSDKKKWFQAIALKLLEFDFRHDDFERFLYAFDDHYFSFDYQFRLQLLQALKTFYERNPYESISLLTSIVPIILNTDTTNEEKDVILSLIPCLDFFGKASLCNWLSFESCNLTDDAFREFLQSEFSSEQGDKNKLARVASVLGYLANQHEEIDQLPLALKRFGKDKVEAIQGYIDSQGHQFGLMTILSAFDYQCDRRIIHKADELYHHKIIGKLIAGNLDSEAPLQDRILVSHMILFDGYRLLESEDNLRTQWYEYVDLILSSNEPDFLKEVCNICFAANIASSVHNYEDWFILLYKFLTHKNLDVQRYAFSLFDSHFVKIWEDDFIEHYDCNWEIIGKWKQEEFQEHLFQSSNRFREWLDLMEMIRRISSKLDIEDQETPTALFDLLLSKTDSSNYLANKLISEFKDRVKDKLPHDIIEKIEITTLSPEAPRFPLGGREQIEKDLNLDNLLPRFDWANYFQS